MWVFFQPVRIVIHEMDFIKTRDEDETANLIWNDSAVQHEKIAELRNYQVQCMKTSWFGTHWPSSWRRRFINLRDGSNCCTEKENQDRYTTIVLLSDQQPQTLIFISSWVNSYWIYVHLEHFRKHFCKRSYEFSWLYTGKQNIETKLKPTVVHINSA